MDLRQLKRRVELNAPLRGQRFEGSRPRSAATANGSTDTVRTKVSTGSDNKGGVGSSADVENLCPKKFYHGRRTTATKFFTRGDTVGYLYLGAAILLELFGTTCLKLSNGFANIFYTAITLVCYGACFYFLSLSLKTVALNIAYATWCGLGIVLATAVAKMFFHETISTAGLIGIVLIVIGVVLCNFFGASH